MADITAQNTAEAPVSAAPSPMRRKKKKKRIVLIVILAVLLIAAAVGIYFLFFKEEEREMLTDVTTWGSLSAAIEGSGTTVAGESETYTVASTAAIYEVNVARGDTVSAGDILFVQDDSEVDDKISELENALYDYQADLYDYQEQLAELRSNVSNLNVTAPFGGIITDVASLEEGDSVNAGARLFTISDNRTMTLKLYFSYEYEDDIYIGQNAFLSVPDQMLVIDAVVADIAKVSYVTDTGLKCFAVTLHASNPGSLTEGQTAGGYIMTDSEEIYPSASGTLQFRDVETVSSKVGGTLTFAEAEDYLEVEAGQILFRIDSDTYENQISNVESQIEHLESSMENTRESIAEAEESRSEYRVASDINGTVISCSVEEGGENVRNMMQSITIYNLDTMTLSVEIDELYIDSVYQGMPVTVTRSSADKTYTYQAEISYLSLEASSSNGVATFPATITIYSNGELPSGVSVSYYIASEDAEEGVLAPVSAIKTIDSQTVLYVQADKRPDNAIDPPEGTDIPDGFYAVPIEAGASNGMYVKILSGVEADTVLFTRYVQTAPGGGDTTSDFDTGEFENMFPGGMGEMPDFGSMGGNMPSFGGGSGGSMPSFGGGSGSGGGMPSFGGSGGGMGR